jgi:hypothetical protein
MRNVRGGSELKCGRSANILTSIIYKNILKIVHTTYRYLFEIGCLVFYAFFDFVKEYDTACSDSFIIVVWWSQEEQNCSSLIALSNSFLHVKINDFVFATCRNLLAFLVIRMPTWSLVSRSCDIFTYGVSIRLHSVSVSIELTTWLY